jgi:LmbE family N-acetylglucosaminyl deacetylase
MLTIEFDFDRKRRTKILCLGAHSDDIEIGCGGTVLKLINEYNDLEFYWVVFSADQERAKEATESATGFLEDAKSKNIVIKEFRDSFFPYIGGEIKEFFERLKRQFAPDLVFTHYRFDLHQDHRLISELTWNTYRDHLILEYEIPKYDGDMGSPNFFIHLEQEECEKKVELLLRFFKSQISNPWFSKDTFMSLLRLRGNESNSQSKYAEAFYCRKLVHK